MTPSDDEGLREAARSIAGTLAKWLEDYHELSTELLKFEHPADREQFYKLAERLISQKIIEARIDELTKLPILKSGVFMNDVSHDVVLLKTIEDRIATLTTKQDTKETTE